MHEAKIIIPNTAKAPGDAARALQFALKACASTFGGYTATQAQGGWINDAGELIEEPVTVLTIAGHSNAGVGMTINEALRWIALRVGRIAAQDCVYVQQPDGEVILYPTRELWDKEIVRPKGKTVELEIVRPKGKTVELKGG